MKKPILKIACAALAITAASGPALALLYDAKADRASAKNVPGVRLTEPHWRPLTAKQIKAAFTGRRLEIDVDYEVAPGIAPRVIISGGGPPVEQFYADGRWERSEVQRAFRVYEGIWTIEKFRSGEHICVEAKGFAKTCRFVWQGASPSSIFMVNLRSKQRDASSEAFQPYNLSSATPELR